MITAFEATHGQNPDIGSQFRSLQLNSSPAYVILGVEPENIQRPNSPADFVASVQSAMVNGKLQPNFAMETTPFYWGHPKKDSTKFNALDYVTSDNYWKNVLRSITLSVASSPSDTFTFGSIPAGIGIGFGAHVQLVQGSVSANVRDNLLSWFFETRKQVLLEQIIARLESNKNIPSVEDWLDEVFENNGSLRNIPEAEQNAIKSLLLKKIRKSSLDTNDLRVVRKIRNEFVKKSTLSLYKVNEYRFPLTREGFMLELAVANARIVADNKWDNVINAKTSVWLTPTYRFNINKDPTVIDFIDLMAVGRFTFNSSNVDSSDYADVGGKLQWIHNRLSLSAECVYRFLTKKPVNWRQNYTYKAGLTFSYKLNEMVTFKTTIGGNFDGNSSHYGDPSVMMIIAGVNFGISGFSPGGNPH
jgi:hypothetical protein